MKPIRVKNAECLWRCLSCGRLYVKKSEGATCEGCQEAPSNPGGVGSNKRQDES